MDQLDFDFGQFLEFKRKQIGNSVSDTLLCYDVVVWIFSNINVLYGLAFLCSGEIYPTIIIFESNFVFTFLIERIKYFRVYCSCNIRIFVLTEKKLLFFIVLLTGSTPGHRWLGDSENLTACCLRLT